MFNCKIPKQTIEELEGSIKKTFEKDVNKMSDMDARVNRLKRVYHWQEAISTSYTQSNAMVQTARNVLWDRIQFTMNKVGLENIRPGQNFKSSLYKLNREVARRSRGYVDEFIAKHEFEQKLQIADRKLNQIAKSNNLDAHQAGLMKTMGVEVGWQPYIKDYQSVSSNGLMFMVKEQERYIKMLEGFNLSQADIEQVVKITAVPVQAYHEMLKFAKQAGVSVNDMKKSGMGYLPHIYSKDYLQRMKWEKELTGSGDVRIKFGDGQKVTVDNAFNKSRETSVFIVEDEIVLDHLLTKYGGADVYKDMSIATGLKITGAGDVFDSDNMLYDAIVRILPEGTTDNLVETGILSKIPMTTDRVFKKLTEAYKLPYESVNQLMVVDYRKGLQLYKKTLEKLATDSNVTYTLVRGAIDEGWGVPVNAVMRDPDNFRGFRRLNDLIPEKMQDDFLLKNDGFDDQALGSVYVHPDVAKTIETELDIVSSPVHMALLGQAIQHLNKWQSTLMLASSSYSGKQYIGNFLQLTSAGGNPLIMVTDTMRRTASLFNKKDMVAMLDNVKKNFTVDGEKLTERELYTKLIGTGYINDYTRAGVEVGSGNYIPKESWIKQAQRTRAQMVHTLTRYPGHFGKTGQELYRYADSIVNDKIGSAARFTNAEFENTAKFALAKTAFGNQKGVGLLLGSPDILRIKNLDQFVDYSSRFFYHYDEAVLGGTRFEGAYKAAQSIMPFLNYRIKNMHGTFRQVLHNPSKYGNYLRQWSLYNDPMYDEDGLPAGGVPEYMGDQMPIIWKIPKEDSGLKQDAFFFFPTAQLIQSFGAISDINHFRELLLGDNSDMIKDKAPDYSQTNAAQRLFQRVLEDENFAWLKIVQAIKDNEHPEYGTAFAYPGSKPQSILGLPVSPLGKYIIEEMIPPVAKLDRWNPGGIFGQQLRKDDYTGEVIPAKDSIFGEPRNSKDTEDRSPFKEDTPSEIGLSLIGAKPNFINVAVNMGNTDADITGALYDAKAALRSLKSSLKTEADPEYRATLTQQIKDSENYIYALEVEHKKIVQWQESHNFTTREAFKLLRQQQIKTETLPDIPKEEKLRIRRELSEQNTKTVTSQFDNL